MRKILRPRPALVCAMVVGALFASTASGSVSPAANHTVTTQESASKLPPVKKPTRVADKVTWALTLGSVFSLDWRKIFSASELWVDANLCEGLMVQTPDGGVAPNLVSSVTRVSRTRYRMKLRPGVTFTDGTRMTAADVAYSYNAITDPKAGSTWAAYSGGAKIAVLNPSTVQFTLPRPSALFLRGLTTPLGWVNKRAAVIAAGDDYGSPSRGVACTGAYRLEQWSFGGDITIAANPRWWGRSQGKRLWNRSVQFSVIQNPSTLASALLAGDVQGAYGVNSSIYGNLANSGKGKAFLGASTSAQGLVTASFNGGLKTLRMRQALANLIDYAGIVRTQYGPTATIAKAPMGPGSWGYAQRAFSSAYVALPKPAQNLTAAKSLAEAVGNPEVKIGTWAGGPTVLTNMATAIASAAKQAGVNVSVKNLSAPEYFALFTPEGAAKSGLDAFTGGIFADIPDPVSYYGPAAIPGGAFNVAGYNNARTSALLNLALRTVDDTARAQLVIQAQRRLVADLAVIPIADLRSSAFMRNEITGAPVAGPLYYYTPWAINVGGS